MKIEREGEIAKGGKSPPSSADLLCLHRRLSSSPSLLDLFTTANNMWLKCIRSIFFFFLGVLISLIYEKDCIFDFIAYFVLCLFRTYFVVLCSCWDKGMREKKIIFYSARYFFKREKWFEVAIVLSKSRELL